MTRSKLLDLLERRPHLPETALGLSAALIPIGFALFAIPAADAFFGDHAWLFFLVFFGPLGLVLIGLGVFFVLSIREGYRELTAKGRTPLQAAICILLVLLVLAGLIVLEFLL